MINWKNQETIKTIKSINGKLKTKHKTDEFKEPQKPKSHKNHIFKGLILNIY